MTTLYVTAVAILVFVVASYTHDLFWPRLSFSTELLIGWVIFRIKWAAMAIATVAFLRWVWIDGPASL